MSQIDSTRIHFTGPSDARESGLYVLYWMTRARRSFWNFAMQYAADRSREIDKPLVVFEPVWLEDSSAGASRADHLDM